MTGDGAPKVCCYTLLVCKMVKQKYPYMRINVNILNQNKGNMVTQSYTSCFLTLALQFTIVSLSFRIKKNRIINETQNEKPDLF